MIGMRIIKRLLTFISAVVLLGFSTFIYASNEDGNCDIFEAPSKTSNFCLCMASSVTEGCNNYAIAHHLNTTKVCGTLTNIFKRIGEGWDTACKKQAQYSPDHKPVAGQTCQQQLKFFKANCPFNI